jgi:hypothetical protein
MGLTAHNLDGKDFRDIHFFDLSVAISVPQCGEAAGALSDRQPLGDDALHSTRINKCLCFIVMHLVSRQLSRTSEEGFPTIG